MVPLEPLFMRLRLMIRDVADREGKHVTVESAGEDVALDKTIADALHVPLLHVVRNAVTHGVEEPELRLARNKPREGLIRLTAQQESGQIVVEVSDDGPGLDLAGLHARGVARGLIPADTPVDSQLVRELVFAPGLTTRQAAGDVAGRGVGGDVVRRA